MQKVEYEFFDNGTVRPKQSTDRSPRMRKKRFKASLHARYKELKKFLVCRNRKKSAAFPLLST